MACWHWKSFYAVVAFKGESPFSVRPSVRYLESDAAHRNHAERGGFCFEPSCPHLLIIGQYELFQAADLSRALGHPYSPASSDSSLILGAFQKWGDRLCEHLDGIFSFAVIDKRARRIFACRDHLGALPFVYSHSGGEFRFAGDMQTMLRESGTPPRLNPATVACCKILSEYRPSPGETFFRGIESLPPGHYAIATSDGVRAQTYWQPSIKPELAPRKDNDVFEQTRFLVEQSILNRIRRRKSIGVTFSGGLDSSVIAA
ncbi:MAG: asnB, partial [Bryobacterales bacterium]|nr:asnB [Bryobacterales bacterium]